MREWELEVLGHELSDVWAADIICFLDLDDLEDLCRSVSKPQDQLDV